MAEGPWQGALLRYEAVKQRLEALGCREVETVSETSRRWEAPTGFAFHLSTDPIDAETLEAIVEAIRKSAKFPPT